MLFTRKLVTTLALTLGFSAAQADPTTPTVSFDSGSTYSTASLANFAVKGDLMEGITVTAYFGDNGSTGPLSWQALSAGKGGVSGSGWSLTLEGDSFDALWVLTNESNSAITRLVINGQPGKIAFDTVLAPELSPGSEAGNAMVDSDGSDGSLSVNAIYRNRVEVGGTIHGDLFTMLDLSFTSAASGGMTGMFVFGSDTDAACTTCRLEPQDPGRVPEPSSLALLGLALLGAGAVRRRRS